MEKGNNAANSHNSNEIYCSECGGLMEEIMEYDHHKNKDAEVKAIVYHCNACGNDEVIETTWIVLTRVRRTFFHG